MRDVATLYRRLSLAGRISRLISAVAITSEFILPTTALMGLCAVRCVGVGLLPVQYLVCMVKQCQARIHNTPPLLTLYVLNCFQETSIYMCILYHFFDTEMVYFVEILPH